MARQKKLILLALFLVAALLLYVGITCWADSDAQEGSGSETECKVLLSFEVEEAQRLAWSYEGESGTETWMLEKRDDTWIWPENEEMVLDQEAVENLLLTIGNLSVDSVFSVDEEADLADYGMDEPLSTITVEFSQDSGVEPVVLLTGDYNNTAYGYYTMVEGGPVIGLTDGSHTELFMQTPENLKYVEEEETESVTETEAEE
ncbi:MAG: DUF4340 domain-containing protein [Firmicutes bacterium]|nr:DUF4340 domain-containing protein [Bacillota bacterium]